MTVLAHELPVFECGSQDKIKGYSMFIIKWFSLARAELIQG
jgi:hypothetical protein